MKYTLGQTKEKVRYHASLRINLFLTTSKGQITRTMVCKLLSFKKHTVSERMNRLFHALVSPLASAAFLSSSLCCFNVFEL